MSAENSTAPVATDGQDPMAGEWAAAVAENKSGTEVASAVEQVAPAAFANFASGAAGAGGAGNDISMILDIPVQLTVELGRAR
ncbi:MAG: flagellar motor switch protein FliN, partial [Aquincola sp.]|nr:flagellar motor switch protein FliN [Aquincola sp.]